MDKKNLPLFFFIVFWVFLISFIHLIFVLSCLLHVWVTIVTMLKRWFYPCDCIGASSKGAVHKNPHCAFTFVAPPNPAPRLSFHNNYEPVCSPKKKRLGSTARKKCPQVQLENKMGNVHHAKISNWILFSLFANNISATPKRPFFHSLMTNSVHNFLYGILLNSACVVMLSDCVKVV